MVGDRLPRRSRPLALCDDAWVARAWRCTQARPPRKPSPRCPNPGQAAFQCGFTVRSGSPKSGQEYLSSPCKSEPAAVGDPLDVQPLHPEQIGRRGGADLPRPADAARVPRRRAQLRAARHRDHRPGRHRPRCGRRATSWSSAAGAGPAPNGKPVYNFRSDGREFGSGPMPDRRRRLLRIHQARRPQGQAQGPLAVHLSGWRHAGDRRPDPDRSPRSARPSRC